MAATSVHVGLICSLAFISTSHLCCVILIQFVGQPEKSAVCGILASFPHGKQSKAWLRPTKVTYSLPPGGLQYFWG